MVDTLIVVGAFLLMALVIVPASIRIVWQYQEGVVFRLGKLLGTRGPGLNFMIPYIDRMIKIDMRIRTMDVPSQEMITSDTVTVRVNAVVYFRVVDSQSAVVRVEQYVNATWQIAQTTLRSVVGSTDLETLLSQRDDVNDRLKQIIDDQTEPWGINVSVVEVKDVELPSSMQRAMARQAESERERRAKVIHAQGESESAHQLAEAAQIINAQPPALQLRYLQTLADIATDRSTVVMFPIPVELMQAFVNNDHNGHGKESAQGGHS